MESDAKTRVQLIDTYFSERQLDVDTLTQIPSVQQFIAAPPAPKDTFYQELTAHAAYALAAGIFRDKRYTSWQLYDPDGELRLYYPLNKAPELHGKSLVPPEDIETVRSGKKFISPVYYSPQVKKASVYIYSPIYIQPKGQTSTNPTYLGFVRATLTLDYIWNIVNEDLGNNGKGSYAFILDENGVRIADTDAERLFKAVAPLQLEVQKQIKRDARYGSTTTSATVLPDDELAQHFRSQASMSTFQSQPTGQQEKFQVVQRTITTLPWKYFVLSPLSTVIAVADQQLQSTLLIAFTTSILIAIIGLLMGRGITYPILASVNHLRENSRSLSTLATRQQDAASEQMWVVDSSQFGLQSVQYYTEAISVAAHELNTTATGLARQWNHADAQQIQQALECIISASRYIENASEYQNASNQKLATALKVATQVTAQIITGATSATHAAFQLEEVVTQLRSLVGK
jgi:hypothetical protein